MTKMPEVLTQTAPGPANDMLSDLLESMQVSGMVLFRAEFREPWSVTSADSGQLAAMLSLGTSRVIPFHVIGSGSCRLDLPDREQPVWLNSGDAVLLPYGYHPVSAAPGYSLYYLWAMAGDERKLALYEDPAHRWIHDQP